MAESDTETRPTAMESRVRYAQGPDELEAALAGLVDADLDVAVAAGEWTIREIINHIAEVEIRAVFMMTVALGNSGAPLSFDWFPGVNKMWGHALAFAARPTAPSLATIRQIRVYMLTLLDAVPDADARHIVSSYGHPEDGWEPVQFTVDEMVRGYSEHIHEHITEIGKIRALHGI